MSPSEALQKQIEAGKAIAHGHPDQPLNAQQLQAIQKDMAARLAAISKDVELRKLALFHACQVAGCASVGIVPASTFVDLANQMHKFLTEETTEAK